MVTNLPDDAQLDALFQALADPIRRGIVARLRRRPLRVGELASAFPVSRPAISKHLDVLERSGLVERVKEGRTNRCVLHAAALDAAFDWLEFSQRHWTGRLDALARLVEAPPAGAGHQAASPPSPQEP